MDFYNQPFDNTYRVQKHSPFKIARHRGYTTVITVSAAEADIWIVAYTIILASSFAAIAKLITGLVLTFANLKRRGNRHVMLAAFYNSESQLTAAYQMAQYAWHSVINSQKGGKWAVNHNTLHFALALMLIAIVNLAIAQGAKFLVARELVVRHAARVNPDIIYYPLPIDNTGEGFFQLWQPLRATAAFQAVGRIATAKEKLKNKVTITPGTGTTNDGQPTLSLSYNYEITGEDLGLQLANFLIYSVRGECTTSYNWLNATGNYDEYTLWGNSSNKRWFPINDEVGFQPWIEPAIHPQSEPKSRAGQGFDFVFLPHTSHRQTDQQNHDDPWYITELNEIPDSNTTFSPTKYRVKRGRPPIRCTQWDTYSLGENKVNYVDKLSDLHGLQLSPFLSKVFPMEFAAPTIIQITSNLGYSSTSSSMYASPNRKAINATRCTAFTDLERLLHVSYVACRETVRNTALVFFPLSKDLGVPNAAAIDGTDKVPDYNADFLLESKDVAALSVPVLISVPCVCTLLWTIVLIRMNYGVVMAKNTGPLSHHNLRLVAFQASQLYRYLDEQISGERKWSGRTTLTPFIRDISKDKLVVNPEENLPVSAAGANTPTDDDLDSTSSFVTPKLVKVPGLPGGQTTWSQDMGTTVGSKVAATEVRSVPSNDLTAGSWWTPWRTLSRIYRGEPSYELVMTRRWKNELKEHDHYVHKKEIFCDI
ncbi:hypothetical protein BDD12DRAFT_801507 [Trichophaea hybrida]|nr:hypothetical protein BDD12DRAFT_801507 [Trichophaea hybrida]